MQSNPMTKLCVAFSLLVSLAAGNAIAADHPKLSLCASCHGAKGLSSSPLIPNLAGQSKDYLAKALGDFKSGERKNAIMGKIVEGLNENDIAQLSTYYSNIKITVD